jgi:hypothetical protein
MKRKFDYYKIYIHNFSYFDAIFLIDSLSRIGDINKPLIRDNNFLKLVFTFKINEDDKRTYRLVFYDSNLLFHSSLRELSKSFGITNPKTYFPFGFMNKDVVDFNYAGNVPKFEDFLGSISAEDYINYCNNFKDKI